MTGPAAASPEIEPTPPRCCIAYCWLGAETYAALKREAESRKMHPDALAATVLATVVVDGLFAAVIDGGR